jgi:predicted aldo/keto reductase-like oxidoreductase
LGGKLANGLSKKAINIFNKADGSLSPAGWALRWLWNQKEVTVVLSGMNEESQLWENIETAKNVVPDMLTADEEKTFDSVVEIIKATYRIPCTGCNYCLPCPHKVNIPACFADYNASYTVGLFSGILQYLKSVGALNPLSGSFAASQCKKCGQCEKMCPQHISIINSLEKVTKRMEPFWIKIVMKLMLKSMK